MRLITLEPQSTCSHEWALQINLAHSRLDIHSDKCSILINPDTDRTGLLHEFLDTFARMKNKMTRVEPRPSKHNNGECVFFRDTTRSTKTGDALAEL